MKRISSNPSKAELLEFLRHEAKEAVKEVCHAINTDPVSDCEIAETGRLADLLNGLKSVPKAIIVNAIDEVFETEDGDLEDTDDGDTEEYTEDDDDENSD